MVSALHTLFTLRTTAEISVEELAELSGVSVGTIRAIESGEKFYNTNYTVAEAIADALYVKVDDIFSKTEVSTVGRTVGTGKPIGNMRKHFTICMNCNCEVHVSHEICVHCDRPVTSCV